MLLFNKKATAQEMEQAGLVSRVIPHAEFQQTVKQVVDECCHLHGRVSCLAMYLMLHVYRMRAAGMKLYEWSANAY